MNPKIKAEIEKAIERIGFLYKDASNDFIKQVLTDFAEAILKTGSGIFDKNGIEVKEGDTLIFPYVTPMGDLDKDNEDFRAKVIFNYGCFGYKRIDFVPLLRWLKKEQGDYEPNYGNKTIIQNTGVFWIETKPQSPEEQP